jgi:hypothetical protein
MVTFKIKGVIREKESGVTLPGLFVKAYDKDLLFDDLLGAAVTDAGGRFEIVSEAGDFRDFFETHPDLYFKIFRQTALLHSTEDAVRWKAGRLTEVSPARTGSPATRSTQASPSPSPPAACVP